jgi:hypothetical protein
LLLAHSYAPVADEHYIRDRRVGARINSAAIRAALQTTLSTGYCTLHVHAHDHRGVPQFGPIDTRTLAELIPSFCAVAPAAVHGALVISKDQAVGRVWVPSHRDPVAARVSLVGYPFIVTEAQYGRAF